MALTLVTILPFLVASTGTPVQCPDDRPIVADGACVSEMDAFVSCIRRTAGERSDMSTSDKSDLEGRVQAEVERLIKVKGSIEGVRKVEKNVVSSYSRTGHPGAEVEIANACLKIATPKRSKRAAGAKAAENKGVSSDLRFRDNYGQINGEGAHDNSQIIQGADKEEVRNVKEELRAVREYSSIARLTFTGLPLDFAGGGDIVYTTPLSALLKPAVEKFGTNQMRFKCDEPSVHVLEKATNQYPKFPFSYFGLAFCSHDAGDSSWRGYALKATEILRETTTIDGHAPEHDQALAKLNTLLAQP